MERAFPEHSASRVQADETRWWTAGGIDERPGRRTVTARHHLLEVSPVRGLTPREAASVTAVERVVLTRPAHVLHP